MYKILLFLSLFLIVSISAKSQTNANEAKAAFLLAEESYGKAEYKEALNYLDQAKKSFGAANSKMLYLQIQIQLELLKTDKSYHDKLITTIADFESAPDYKDFNEEKTLEVTKAKLKLKNDQQRDAQQILEAATKRENGRKVFLDFTIKGWPVNITLTDLQVKYKQDSLFTNGLKDMKDTKYNAVFYYPSKYKFWKWPNFRIPFKDTYFVRKPGMYGILTKNGIVKGYASIELEHDDRDKAKGLSYDSASKEFETLLAEYTELFDMQPKHVAQPSTDYYQNEDYVWELGDKRIILEHHFGPAAKGISWHVSADLTVIYK
jgi:hypothetical protein